MVDKISCRYPKQSNSGRNPFMSFSKCMDNMVKKPTTNANTDMDSNSDGFSHIILVCNIIPNSFITFLHQNKISYR